MADKNKIRLVVGLVSIIVAFICVIGIFYFVVEDQKVDLTKIDNLETQLSDFKIIHEQTEEELQTLQKAPPKPITLQDILKESKKIYSQDEKNRKEGYLWIDQKASTFIVTLGALNGLKPGSRLGVYEGDKKVGQVVVETPLDVTSYVQPVDQFSSASNQNYFRVVKE